MFLLLKGGAISKGGHVSSLERGGPLAWEVHWHGGGGGGVVPPRGSMVGIDRLNVPAIDNFSH